MYGRSGIQVLITLFILIASLGMEASATQVVTADGEVPVEGTVIGSYADTQTGDGVYESIEEVESGGKPSKRKSLLEHKWTFNVPAGSYAVFHVKAYHTPNAEGDDFEFAWSVDDQTYSTFLQVIKTSDDGNYDSASLPSSLSGTLHIRITDVDRTRGNRVLDTVFVDHMYIETGGFEYPPAEPSDLDATATSGSSIRLDWTDNANNEEGFRIERSMDGSTWFQLDTVGSDITTFEDTGLEQDTTYYYIVQAFNAYGESGWSNMASATTTISTGHAIVFIKGGNAGGNILVAPADGSETTQVYRGMAIRPRFSPDGTRIAFMALKGQTTSLYTINTDGTGLTLLVPITYPYPRGLGLDWSPDGTRIAFADSGPGGKDVYTIRPDGSELTNITNTPDSDEHSPTWSPTGERLLIQSSTLKGDLIVLDLDSNGNVTGETNITDIPGSPLQNSYFLDPAWARTSDKVVVSVPEVGILNPYDSWVIDMVDPGNPVNLTSTPGIEERHCGFDDVDHKIYYRRDHNGHDAIWRMNLDGTNQSVFLFDPKSDYSYPSFRR